ncbi:hypothetical protein psal_cds_1033 [Pandoravirus salinus]|uniref:Uncharacterized protein n=1 Tax=Pandoravirus salinus TaxID=1349410 RepID=S4VXX6_9VIRU|nr:hypothetical protein psal_cds_1033 [Pandoravirus salinus]AGO85223.1 hypothetical protein psal_cds_1033 [Pandoravirus salinus]
MYQALDERRCEILDKHQVRACRWPRSYGDWPSGLDRHHAVVRARPQAVGDLLGARCRETELYGEEPRNGSQGWKGFLIEVGHGDSCVRAFVALPYSYCGYEGDQDWDDGDEKQDVHVFTDDPRGIDAVKALLPRLAEATDWCPRKFTLIEIDALVRAEIRRRFDAGANAD